MNSLMKTLPFAVLMAFGGAAFAQGTETPPATDETAQTADTTPDAATEDTSADALALSMGEEAAGEVALGAVYIDSKYVDWELRCIKSEAEIDPCQIYQLLGDGKGNPVAEINIFPLPAKEEAAAGATVITPLETLLTQQLSLSVDGSKPKKYPFSWCSDIGCFSRMGFSDGDIAIFKKGVSATLTIVPVAAPDQKVNLKVSLSGFTAAYDAAFKRLPK